MRSLTEDDLFVAYRVADGRYVTDCACGGTITAESGSHAVVEAAIDAHNATALHLQWREWQDAVKALQRPTRHPCPCHGHSDA